jgi:hypothetical protein
MNKIAKNIVFNTLKSMIVEQAPPAAPAAGASAALETDNAESDNADSPFTPAEKRFLGKFDAYGTQHIGIIYSLSDIGIREFIVRSGKDLNLTPEILLKMVKDGFIKIVPYTGWGRNNDYTLELQLSLDDVAGLGADDKAKAEKGSSASGAAPEAAPAPEVAWVIKYGDVLSESAKVVKKLISEKKSIKQPKNIYVEKSRMLKQLPKQYIKHLEHLITALSKKQYTVNERERLIADILDNLALNMNLSDKQIAKSYEFHKKQKRLQKVLNKS